MASTAEDLSRLLVSIELSQAKTEKQAAAIARAAEKAAKKIDGDFRVANDNVARGFQRSGQQVERSLGAQRAAVSNLSFQLNDIAMGLASGTSPFTIMVQQGSQVAQALQGPGGLIGAVKTIGGAFAQMVNPVSLASFALIGLTGAAVKYLTTLGGDTKDTNELLKTHAELIKSFDAAFGIAEKGAKRYSATLKAVELQKIKDEFGNLGEAAKAAAKDIEDSVLGISRDEFGGATKSIADMNKALDLLDREVPDFTGFSAAMSAIENSDAPQNVKDLAKQFRLSAQDAIPLQDAITSTDEKLRAVTSSGETVRKSFEALTSAALGWGEGGASAIDTVVNKVKGDLIPSMTTAAGQLMDYMRNFASLQKQIDQTPLGAIPPVFSGGGKFLNPAEEQDYRANNTKSQFEMEQEKLAKSVAKVTDTFDRLNNGVVKNYVNQVIKAESGGDANAKNPNSSATGIGQFISSTWLKLFRENFPDRAKSMSDATILALRSDADISRSLIEAYAKDNADLLRQAGVAVNEAALHLAHFLGPQGAINVLKAAPNTPVSQLLSQDAIRANPSILGNGATAGDVVAYGNRRAADTADMAANYKTAAQAAREFDKAQKEATRSAQDLGSAVGGALKGLIDAFSDGKLEAGELLDIVGKLVLQLGQMPGGFLTGSGGGFLGGILGAFFHDGGVAGGPAKHKAMSPSTWAGAKRYHTGGMAGLMPGEIPAILQRGEVVLPRGTRMGSGGQTVVINAPINAPGADAAALSRVQKSVDDLRKAVPKMVDRRQDTRSTRKTRA